MKYYFSAIFLIFKILSTSVGYLFLSFTDFISAFITKLNIIIYFQNKSYLSSSEYCYYFRFIILTNI